MWRALLFFVGSQGIDLDNGNRVSEISECLLAISDKYLESRCLAFLFPLNFSNPSLKKVPPLVRTSLLKTIHSKWAPNLPARNKHNMHIPFLKPGPGPLCYLQCSNIIILDDKKSYIDQINHILYTFYSHFYENGGGQKSRIVVVVSGTIKEDEIFELLFYMYTMGDIDVIFVGFHEGVITVFTMFYFGNDGRSCPEENKPEILDTWKNGSFVKGIDLFPNKIPKKFNNCLVKIGAVHQPPFFSLKDGKATGGVEHRIVETIAEYMGLRTDYVTYNNRPDAGFWMEKDGPHGTNIDLRRGKVWMIVSLTNNFIFTFGCTFVPHSYWTSHKSWFFKNPEKLPTWKMIFLGFSKVLWILVLAATVTFPYCLYLLAKCQNKRHPFQRLSTSMVASCGLVVGNSATVKLNHVYRIVFASWLFYTIHINLAYSAALTSLMTAGKVEPKITSFEQIVQRNITTALAKNFVYQSAEVDDSVLKTVLSNRIVVEDYRLVYPQVIKWGNVSLLMMDLPFINEIKEKKLALYDSGLNLGFTYVGIKLRRNHFINDRIAELSARFFEAGFTAKLVKDYTAIPKQGAESNLKAFSLFDLAGPFLILAIGCAASFLIFIGEILQEKVKKCSTLKNM